MEKEWVSFFLYLWVSASLTEGWSPALNIRSYSRSRALIRDSPRSRSRSYDFISISIRRSSATSSDPQSQNPPSSQEESRISILRKGSTQVGPSNRPVTIFPGDYCVHRDLGIARFVDCVVDERWPMISVIRLAFGNNAEYIVDPVDREKISRLKSSDAAKPPKLTPLTEKGRAAWKMRVDRVKESTKVIAQDILALYAARNQLTREPCVEDNEDFIAFEKQFDFVPTPDQQQCFNDVAYDMVCRRTPMDRLVCGDVGFGKTEIAMRAIFRAVQNKRQ